MTISTKYTYSIQNDFINHIVDTSRLTREIRNSAIIIALDYINTSGDDCDIWFKDDLGTDNKIILDQLISVHSGAPEPQQGTLADGTPLVAISQRQGDGLPQFAIAPTVGTEVVIASHNLCDKCTWFADSIRVNEEILVDSGDGYTFNSAHEYWIDTISGRFYDDDGASNMQKATHPEDPHGYLVVVKVNGIEQTMREPFETSGGDYEVIWEAGQIKFFNSPVEAPVVSYSYAEGSTFYVRPLPGKMLRILKAEADVSVGCTMTDTILYSVYALVDAVAPELVAAEMVPTGTMIPIGEATYKRMGQISAEAQGAYPSIEVLGASQEELAMSIDEFRRKSRGTRTKVQALPFNYSTTRDLSSAAQMEIRVHLKHDRVFIGDTVTVTFYCVSKDE